MSIRKVLGANLLQLWMSLSFDFLRLVGVSFVFAAPIAYGIVRRWLQQYTYHVAISWWVFALAGLLAGIVALLTVSFQAYKAARNNPLESLRTD